MLTKAEAGNLKLHLGLLMWVTGTQVCHLLPFQDAHEPEVSEAEKPGLEPGPPTWDAEAPRDSRAHLQDAYSAQAFLLLLLFLITKMVNSKFPSLFLRISKFEQFHCVPSIFTSELTTTKKKVQKMHPVLAGTLLALKFH